MLEFDFISFPKYFVNRNKMYKTIYCVQWTKIIKGRRLRKVRNFFLIFIRIR